MRDRFLSRVASEVLLHEINEGPRLHPFVVKKLPSLAFEKEQCGEQPRLVEPVLSGPKSRLFSFLSRAAAVVGACVIVGTAAFYAGVGKGKQTAQQPTKVQAPGTVASASNSQLEDADRFQHLEDQKSSLEIALAKLKQELSAAHREKQSASDELTTAKDRLAALTIQEKSASDHSSAELQEARNKVYLFPPLPPGNANVQNSCSDEISR